MLVLSKIAKATARRFGGQSFTSTLIESPRCKWITELLFVAALILLQFLFLVSASALLLLFVAALALLSTLQLLLLVSASALLLPVSTAIISPTTNDGADVEVDLSFFDIFRI